MRIINVKCQLCPSTFEAKKITARFCPACRKKRDSEKTSQWAKQNRALITSRARERYKADPQKAVAIQKKYRQKHPERIKRANRFYLLKSYGITLEEYARMEETQKGLCYICGIKPKSGRLSVDHCHVTNCVRALLCSHCNAGLGSFKDSPELLEKAIIYLNKYKRLETTA